MKTTISFLVVTYILFATACKKENNAPYVSVAISNSSQAAQHFIGEHFGGGIIFYLDEKKQHGLIAATTDTEEPGRWAYADTITNARGIKIGSGFGNTRKIVVVQGYPGADAEDYAALEIAEIAINGYSDWVLPSKAELNELYKQKNAVGGFGAFAYWSSTEADASNAWFQNFGNGSQYKETKTAGYSLRPIRYF